jgi:hypothetical protein
VHGLGHIDDPGVVAGGGDGLQCGEPVLALRPQPGHRRFGGWQRDSRTRPSAGSSGSGAMPCRSTKNWPSRKSPAISRAAWVARAVLPRPAGAVTTAMTAGLAALPWRARARSRASSAARPVKSVTSRRSSQYPGARGTGISRAAAAALSSARSSSRSSPRASMIAFSVRRCGLRLCPSYRSLIAWALTPEASASSSIVSFAACRCERSSAPTDSPSVTAYLCRSRAPLAGPCA